MTTVFIVEDHPSMQEAYALLFEQAHDLDLCGIAATAAEARIQIPALHPAVVLVDLSLPDVSGMALVQELNRQLPDIHYVVVSGNDAASYRTLALQAGASGYLDKWDASTHLIPFLRRLVSDLPIAS
ncbi:MAG: hypothetical protein RhofKO_32550 [Rhodothermales bacterium]